MGHRLLKGEGQMREVQVVGEKVALHEAQEIVRTYCFDEEALDSDEWKPHGNQYYGTQPEHLRAPKWAYRFYDCTHRSHGNDLTTSDFLAICGLEMQLSFDTLRQLHAVAPLVSEAVSRANVTAFWDLPEEEVPKDGSAPPEGTSGWWLGRAWWLLMSIDSVGVATTHKILHHKWPALFPLIDNLTRREIRRRFPRTQSSWRVIYDDLKASPKEWEELEDWFENEAAEGEPLKRLRLHDIVLWRRADDGRNIRP